MIIINFLHQPCINSCVLRHPEEGEFPVSPFQRVSVPLKLSCFENCFEKLFSDSVTFQVAESRLSFMAMQVPVYDDT